MVEEFIEKCETVDPVIHQLMDQLSRQDKFWPIFAEGRQAKERSDPRGALPHFVRAWRTLPESALAAYRVAFELFLLGRYSTALTILFHMESWTEEDLERTTRRSAEQIRSDFAFLGFLITKRKYPGWSPAGEYLLRNLEARARGIEAGCKWKAWREEVCEFAEDPLTSDPRLAKLIETLDRQEAQKAKREGE